MATSAASVLKDLRDIPGVMGSFVLSAEGDPQLRDLPSVVHDEALSAVGPRVMRLLEAAKQQNDVTYCALRFTEHRLHLKPAGSYLLCVLSDKSVNLPTLQMGMTLVTRRISTMDLSAPAVDRETIPSPAPQMSAPPQAPLSAHPAVSSPGQGQGQGQDPGTRDSSMAASSRRPQMYRGRRID